MSLTLSDLATDRRTITVKYLGRDVSVTYKPSVYTGEMFSRLNVTPTFQFVAELVAEWDVLDGDTMLAIEPESVAKLPIGFLRVVADGIIEDVNQGEVASS